ncbi:MAG: hypothetical protein WC759_05245, partial [Candidatus Micrarchaeia archaeon]
MVFGLFEGAGNIEINLDNSVFQEGGKISGRVVLRLKKPRRARGLRLEFYGEVVEKKTRIGSKGSRTTSSTSRIGQQTIMLKGEGDYGDGEEYAFAIQIPKGMMPYTPEMPGGLAGTVLGLAGMNSPR